MDEEIEKLLNKVRYNIQKHINQGYDVEMLVPLEFDVSEWTLLLNYTMQLQNNWNELKKWLEEEYEHCDKIGNPAIGCAMGQIKRIKSKMQELEGNND